MSDYLVEIQNERLSFFTPAGEVKALNDVSIHLDKGEVLEEIAEPYEIPGTFLSLPGEILPIQETFPSEIVTAFILDGTGPLGYCGTVP